MLCVNSRAALRSALLTDIGIAALQICAVANEIAGGRLIRVLAAEALPESGIYAVYPSTGPIASSPPRCAASSTTSRPSCVSGWGAGLKVPLSPAGRIADRSECL